jgi:hypothetical protein
MPPQVFVGRLDLLAKRLDLLGGRENRLHGVGQGPSVSLPSIGQVLNGAFEGVTAAAVSGSRSGDPSHSNDRREAAMAIVRGQRRTILELSSRCADER